MSFEPHNFTKKFAAVIEYNSPKIEMLNKSTSTDVDISDTTPTIKRSKHRIGRSIGRRTFFKHRHQFSQQPARKCRSQLISEQSAIDITSIQVDSEPSQDQGSKIENELQNRIQSPHKQEQFMSENEDGLQRTSIMYFVRNVMQLSSCEIHPVKQQPEEVKG